MAKKNVRDDPSKTQVTENPQMSDIVLVLDKMELLIQAVSEINKNGKYSTAVSYTHLTLPTILRV